MTCLALILILILIFRFAGFVDNLPEQDPNETKDPRGE
tara:strand:- start:748 stop:861 length:114 start_codon:yes stop_codon:yes gene_type:complete